MNAKLLKILSVILTVALVLGCFAVGVNATTQTGKINALSFKINNGEAAITDCDNVENVTVPSEIEGCEVSAIGNFAFENCTSLKKISLPKSIKTVGFYSFSGCTSLTDIALNEGLLSIGVDAFENCIALKKVVLPSSVKKIDGWAFEGCKSLESITLDEQLESIGEWAFKDCSKLTSAEIPQNVTSIGKRAFAGCSSVQFFAVSGTNKNYSSDFSGILYDKNQTVIINYPLGKASNYFSLPSTIIDICDYAFYKCNSIETVVLKDSVKTIGKYAFAMCPNLKSIKLTKNIEKIDQNAFYGCESLKTADLPASLKTVEKYAFYGCNSMTSFSIKENVEFIGESAFSNCNCVESFNVSPDNENYASDSTGVLYNKDFTGLIAYPVANPAEEYNIVASATELYEDAFYNAKNLKSVTVPKGLVNIGEYSIGYIYDESSKAIVPDPDLTINCYRNSDFHTYASSKGFKLNFLNDAVITRLEINDFAMKSGDTKTLSPIIETSGELAYKCEYISSDPAIASIQSNNSVKGVKFGEVTITLIATDENGNKYVDMCICKVQRGTLEMLSYVFAFGWLADLFKK